MGNVIVYHTDKPVTRVAGVSWHQGTIKNAPEHFVLVPEVRPEDRKAVAVYAEPYGTDCETLVGYIEREHASFIHDALTKNQELRIFKCIGTIYPPKGERPYYGIMLNVNYRIKNE